MTLGGDLTRRDWLRALAAGGGLLAAAPETLGAGSGNSRGRGRRRFHACLSPAIAERDDGLLDVVREAGVDTVWLASFFYGHEPFSEARMRRARARVEAAGMAAELVQVPLGHPGDSLGAKDGDFPLSPPAHWRVARRPDGRVHAGTSLHDPATAENVASLRRMRGLGFRKGFLDDDFRLARGPGEIGGCFCDAHRDAFLRAGGYGPDRWTELLEDVGGRRFTPLLRAWLDFHGRELTASFRAQRRAFRGDLGIMAMYLGAEKAGLRLAEYRGVPFRVGELMFDDRSFGPVKGKTDELFSALFHRRFAEPDRAYSETTAFPSDRLSAPHLAAKLAVSTLADVRNTMFMSGLTPFPREHWAVLGPAMRAQARWHSRVAGARLRGPFRHYWGEAERYVGEDRPFSLWLALGIPFEVVEKPTVDGWTFWTEADARAWSGREVPREARWVGRTAVGPIAGRGERVEESLPELFAFKRRILGQLGEAVPHIVEDRPAVCAWYPSVRRVLVWNLSDAPCQLTLKQGARHTELPMAALGMAEALAD